TLKTIGLILFIGLIVAFFWASSSLSSAEFKKNVLSYSELNQKVNSNEVESIEEQGSQLKVTLKEDFNKDDQNEGKKFVVVRPGGELRDDQKIDVSKTNYTTKEPSGTGDAVWGVAQLLVPGLLILGFFF